MAASNRQPLSLRMQGKTRPTPSRMEKMADTIPILTFHALDQQPSVISFSPDLFRTGLARLRDKGLQTVRFDQAVDCLRRQIPFPSNSFVITFDDGYRSVYQEAFPALQDFGMSATVFITVGTDTSPTPNSSLPSLQNRAMLTWREISELHNQGIEIGAHTLTHADLTKLSAHQVEREVRNSKAIIEEAIGSSVHSFAYPFGRYNEACRAITQRHFKGACSDSLAVTSRYSDPFAIERVDAYYLRSERLFALLSNRFFAEYVRLRNFPRRLRRLLHFGP